MKYWISGIASALLTTAALSSAHSADYRADAAAPASFARTAR